MLTQQKRYSHVAKNGHCMQHQKIPKTNLHCWPWRHHHGRFELAGQNFLMQEAHLKTISTKLACGRPLPYARLPALCVEVLTWRPWRTIHGEICYGKATGEGGAAAQHGPAGGAAHTGRWGYCCARRRYFTEKESRARAPTSPAGASRDTDMAVAGSCGRS